MNRYENDVYEHGLLVATKGTVMEHQTVLAIGDAVRNVKVGDLVLVNPRRFQQVKYKQDELKNDIEEYNPVVKTHLPMMECNGELCLFITDGDIDYVVEDKEEVEDEKPSAMKLEKPALILPRQAILS